MSNKPVKQSKKKKSKSLEKEILRYVMNNSSKRYSKKQIIKKFQHKASKEETLKVITGLISRGDLKLGYDKRILVGNKESSRSVGYLFEGTVDMTKSGAAYIVVDAMEEDIYVPARLVNRAFDRDTVKVNMFKRSGKKREGEIVEIVKRAQDVFIGTIQKNNDIVFLIPDKINMQTDFFIPLEDSMGAEDGDKAMVEMTEWKKRDKNPIGKVIELLGHAGDQDIEMKSILLDNGFKLQFPAEVSEQAEKLQNKIPAEEIKNRIDFRDVTTFTIDPEDAKDFDDALSYRILDNNNYEIGIHIADVTFYVPEDSALDKEAYERSTSVYLVDRVCPMLPEMLSNLICSLRPKEDKLCYSVICEFDKDFNLVSYAFHRTIINSDKRFAYEEAQIVLETGEGPFAEELSLMNKIAKSLRKKRFEKGAINFDTVEFKFEFDPEGHAIGIKFKERKDAHLLIEDFMLLANESVAKYLSAQKSGSTVVPSVYRVHDSPDKQKLEIFANIARKFGFVIKFKDPKQTAEVLNGLTEKLKGREEANILEQLAIRSMAKAVYTTKNIGHFGLAMEKYTHFTSPIRRYPDVLVHRILNECLNKQTPSHTQSFLEDKCRHTSTMERSAQDAERASIKYKQVEYISHHIGETFEAIISGIIPRGIFVEMIENKCEGFIHTDNLGDEEFVFEENDLTLIGSRTYTKFQFGQKIKVVVAAANKLNKTIDCQLVNT